MTDILDAFVTDVVNIFPGVDSVYIIETGGVGPAGPAGTGSGLPSGGTPEQIVVNTGPGTGTWGAGDDLLVTDPSTLASDILANALGSVYGTAVSISGQLTNLVNTRTVWGIVPTRTTNYTAVSDNELVQFDTTAGPLNYTLPTSPDVAARAAVIIVAGSNTVTIHTAGSAVFTKAGGPTTLVVTATDRAVEVNYDLGTGVWTILSDPADVSGLIAATDATAEHVARRGAANGYPSLDGGTKVPVAQLPTTDIGILGVKTTVGPTDSFLTTDGQQATEAVIAAKLADGTSILNTTGVLSVKDGGVTSAKIADGTIVNADISGSAAIAYGKLALSASIVSGDIVDGTIVNADINGSAGITLNKLAAGTMATPTGLLIVTEVFTVPVIQLKQATADAAVAATYGTGGISYGDRTNAADVSFGRSAPGVWTAGTNVIIAGDATAATHLINRQTGDARYGQLSGYTMAGNITFGSGNNLVLSTTTGTKIGTGTTQLLGFFNATPIVQPASTTDLRTCLINLGLLATGGATPLNLNGGAFTTSGLVTISANNIATDTTTGMQIATGTTQKLGFWGTTPVVRASAYTQTFATATRTHAARTTATVTDSTGGTKGTTLAAVTGTTYSTDIPTIRTWAASIMDQVAKTQADLANTAQVVNQLLDDLQLYGVLA